MAYALVSNVSAGSTAGAAVTTAAIDTSGASLLVVILGDYTLDSSTMSDSKSNSWSGLTQQSSSSGTVRCRMYYAANPTVGTNHTFTATPATTSYPTICAAAFGGAKLTSPFDVENGAFVNNTPTTSVATGSITPSEDNELVVAGLALSEHNSIPHGAVSINSGLTITNTVAFDGADHFGVSLAYIIQTSASAVNPTWSWEQDDFVAAVIGSFKVATAATGWGALMGGKRNSLIGGV